MNSQLQRVVIHSSPLSTAISQRVAAHAKPTPSSPTFRAIAQGLESGDILVINKLSEDHKSQSHKDFLSNPETIVDAKVSKSLSQANEDREPIRLTDTELEIMERMKVLNDEAPVPMPYFSEYKKLRHRIHLVLENLVLRTAS